MENVHSLDMKWPMTTFSKQSSRERLRADEEEVDRQNIGMIILKGGQDVAFPY